MAFAIFRYRLIDLVPVAHGTVMQNLEAAVIVLDAQHRVVDINPAALRVLGREGSAIGVHATALWSQRRDLVERYLALDDAHEEVALTVDGEPGYFDLRMHALTHRDGRIRGRLLVLHDVTELRRAHEDLQRADDAQVRRHRAGAGHQPPARRADAG